MTESLQKQQLIREMAYRRWEEAGRPDVDELQFWLDSEKEYVSQNSPELSAEQQDRLIDEASKESFPSSDPPAFNTSSA